MKKSVVTAALTLAALAATGAHAAPVGRPEAAQYKVAMCIGCHGIEDYRTAFPEVYHVPKLGGQNAGYIAGALREYRSGNRHYATMHAIAVSLSDQDIADIAAYYAAQTPTSKDNAVK
ncbi:MAG: c-type cytochrome [Janthinobacterium lividum]